MIYDAAVSLLTANAGNIAYLTQGSDASVKVMLDDPNAFRGNKMNQLKQANDELAVVIESVLVDNRAKVSEAIEDRRAEILASAAYGAATPEGRGSVVGKVDAILERISSEQQIAMIREIGNSFDETVYPMLLDELAAAAKGEGGENPPPKPTISVKSVSAAGAPSLLETDVEVDAYLAALRTALIGVIKSGKRISI